MNTLHDFAEEYGYDHFPEGWEGEECTHKEYYNLDIAQQLEALSDDTEMELVEFCESCGENIKDRELYTLVTITETNRSLYHHWEDDMEDLA